MVLGRQVRIEVVGKVQESLSKISTLMSSLNLEMTWSYKGKKLIVATHV